jgi:Flp pilus assembly protein TadG
MKNIIIGRFQRAAEITNRFAADVRGAAAVEFVFVATLLITLYLGTQQVSLSLNMNKKVGRAAASISELVSRSESKDIDRDVLRDIMKIGAAILQPYEKTLPTVTVTGIQISPTGTQTVAFSQRLADGNTFTMPIAKGSTASIPASLAVNDTFLVKVDVELKYQMITSWRTGQTRDADGFVRLPMKETYYMRARHQDTLTCDNC